MYNRINMSNIGSHPRDETTGPHWSRDTRLMTSTFCTRTPQDVRCHDVLITFARASNAEVIFIYGFFAFLAFGASTLGLFNVVRCRHLQIVRQIAFKSKCATRKYNLASSKAELLISIPEDLSMESFWASNFRIQNRPSLV